MIRVVSSRCVLAIEFLTGAAMTKTIYQSKKTKMTCRVAVKKKTTGQAPALPPKVWKLWIEWTSMFGLRCGDCVALQREDLNLDSDIPKVRV